jgi:hypothetical protein
VRGLDLQGLELSCPLFASPALDDSSSELSRGISAANRLSPLMLPNPCLFSPGAAGWPALPGIAKLPKFPIGARVALAGVLPHGDAGPFPRVLPAVLLRIKPPNGKAVFDIPPEPVLSSA